ncbi:hypothetical protein AV530_007588 [Patagioenas fasciata monilis]|uniref:Uncharacterized protein n=1 Tax=Patagioenas fasciata monilis TaxID=372326 RepID=A0A1V4JYD0_PATFA|nr:hypothetical protein AV530_007588 [Patagioenas fasciata monilis]
MKIFHPEDADVDVACDVRCELVMSKAASTQDERVNHSEEDSAQPSTALFWGATIAATSTSDTESDENNGSSMKCSWFPAFGRS